MKTGIHAVVNVASVNIGLALRAGPRDQIGVARGVDHDLG
jgi:hypothetical protein